MNKEYKINKKIYSEEIINQVILNFEDVLKIKYSNDVLIIIGENEAEIDEVFNEFMSYTIGLINEK